MSKFKLPPQIARVLVLTVLIVVSFLIARALLTPASFGQFGWYRADALAELRVKTPVYAGQKACDECHSEVTGLVAKHEHKTVSCESCHGVGQAHADNPDVKFVKLSDHNCLRCHEANPARPKWLKQIKPQEHYKGERCAECHVPHQPNEVP